MFSTTSGGWMRLTAAKMSGWKAALRRWSSSWKCGMAAEGMRTSPMRMPYSRSAAATLAAFCRIGPCRKMSPSINMMDT
ncbi:hypothetical protein ACLESD_45460 [Pyxidicoccus sp. 3LFB2]